MSIKISRLKLCRNQVVLCLIILAFSLLPTVKGIQQNIFNTQLLRIISHYRDNEFMIGSTTKNVELGLLANKKLNSCQWLNYIYAQSFYSNSIAIRLLENAEKCDRRNLYFYLYGELAWQLGDRELAKVNWKNIELYPLMQNGYRLLQGGEIEKGRTMLILTSEKLSAKKQERKYPQLFTYLGHSYRYEERWLEAIKYYEIAVGLVPKNVENIFFLGMSCRGAGYPFRAVQLLETHIPNLPALQPGFKSSYFVQIGLAYSDLSEYEKAMEAFKIARYWINIAGYQDSPNALFINEQITDLDRNNGIYP